MPQQQMTIEQALEMALAHHQAGRLSQAESIYRQILSQQPNHPHALHLTGVLATQVGNFSIAIDLIRRAIAAQPGLAIFHSNLGNALRGGGDLQSAIVEYRAALQMMPDSPEILGNLGVVLHESGQIEQAVATFRQALQRNPNDASAHNNLSVSLARLRQFTQAVQESREAIRLKPDYPEAHNNLGNVLQELGQNDHAVSAYQAAVQLNPNYAKAHANLGEALRRVGRPEQAIAALATATRLQPDLVEAHNTLGDIYHAKGLLDDAADAYERAIQLSPHPVMWNNLANVRRNQGMLDESIECLKKAIAIDPDCIVAHSNLIYATYFHPVYDAHRQAAEHARWAERFAEPLKSKIIPHSNDRDPNRPLRIGYVGSDFRGHSQTFFTLPLLSHHDRSQFRIHCYANLHNPDAMTYRLKEHADEWRGIFGEADDDVVKLIREDRIDILVDLSLHMKGNRLTLFAQKPAPLQVTWLGFPGTTGLDAIDYRITDPHLDPPGSSESSYSERSIRLPDSFWCYDPLIDGPDINELPSSGSGQITFGCMNSFAKLNDPVIELWAQTMKAVSDSRLFLLAGEGKHRQHFLDRMQARGVGPERIRFTNTLPRRKYLQAFNLFDISLDTFPANGHTTSFDSLWMGVPVVTRPGSTAISRGGLSILSNMQLPELVASSGDDFVRIVVELCNDLARLAELRRTLRPRLQASPLMDAPRFARNMEAAYRAMWRAWCAGGKLESCTI